MSRRWLLLIVGLVVGVTIITISVKRPNRPRDDDQPSDPAVAAIEQAGGKVDREGGSPDGRVVRVQLGRKHVTDADVERLAAFTGLEEVRLPGTNVTDAGLRHLRPLQQLRILDLRGTPVTDAGLAELRNHPLLEELVLIQTNVTDAGLEELVTLRHLRRLEVPPACLTPRAFRTFCELGLVEGFPGLRDVHDRRAARPQDIHTLLYPAGPAAADHFADWLTEIPTLRVFQLEAPQVTDEVLRALGRQGKLHMLQAIGPTPGGFGTMGMMAPEARERMEAARPRRDEDLTHLWLSHCAITDAGLDAILGLQQLRSLALDHTRISAQGIGRLAALPNLNSLSARGVHLTVADLQPLRDRPNLGLRADFDVSDAGLKKYREAGVLHLFCETEEVPGCPDQVVRTLDLSHTPVTDAGLAALADLPNLGRLVLGSPAITDEGLRHLGGLPDLAELDLTGTAVTGRGLRHLAGLPKLESLNLGTTGVTDAGLKELSALKALRRLNLLLTEVTDAGLVELARLTGLKELDLSGTPTTDAGIEKLQAALPDCKIVVHLKRQPR